MASPKGLVVKNKVSDMSIGDCIPFRYTASTQGAIGVFSEFGTCTSTEIPYGGGLTVDGLAYFIKADKGLLICDRILQHSLSWDVINTSKLYRTNDVPKAPFTSYTDGYVTISSNGEYSSSLNAWKMLDNNGLTYWMSDTFAGTVYLTFLNPEKVYDMYFRSTGAAFITIEYSDDNKNWTFAASGQLGPANQLEYVDVNTTIKIPNNIEKHKYWRFSAPYSNNQGNYFYISEFKLTSGDLYKLRLLYAGNAYIDDYGRPSKTNKDIGAFPENNEWEKYIVKSTLNGKITPGDNEVWHWNNGASTISEDTPIDGYLDNQYNSNYKICRGNYQSNSFKLDYSFSFSNGATSSYVGFRPVFEYVDSFKQKTLWY